MWMVEFLHILVNNRKGAARYAPTKYKINNTKYKTENVWQLKKN